VGVSDTGCVDSKCLSSPTRLAVCILDVLQLTQATRLRASLLVCVHGCVSVLLTLRTRLGTENTWPFIKTPIFPLNSMYDTWQLGCILTSTIAPEQCSAFPTWASCITNPEACNSTQIATYVALLCCWSLH
jgi:hypothetical protein